MAMPIFYAMPFVAFSLIALALCLLIPGLRRHALTVAVAPVAFGFFSIGGVGLALLVENATRFATSAAANQVGFGLMGAVFVISGIVGVWVSVTLTRSLLRRLLA